MEIVLQFLGKTLFGAEYGGSDQTGRNSKNIRDFGVFLALEVEKLQYQLVARRQRRESLVNQFAGFVDLDALVGL